MSSKNLKKNKAFKEESQLSKNDPVDQSGPDESKTINNLNKKDQTNEKPNSNVFDRVKFSIILVAFFCLIISMGHFYMALFVMFINYRIFKEVTNIAKKGRFDTKDADTIRKIKQDDDLNIWHKNAKARNQPILASFYKLLHTLKYAKKLLSTTFAFYYFFIIGISYFLIRAFETKIGPISSESFIGNQYVALVSRKDLHFFILWILGLMFFVMNLKRENYRYQIEFFALTHLAILNINLQIMLQVINLYDGMVWLVLPAMMVICNDIFAYIFGKIFGRTPLIEISPKKTWEGFIGGFIGTFFFTQTLANWFEMPHMRFMLCPQESQTFMPFSHNWDCDLSYIYEIRPIYIPIYSYFGGEALISEFKVHCGVLAIFAALVAPFGGFFASGIKRAFGLKDFADIIPGHGGFLDRFDCQVPMGTFVFFYLREVIKGYGNTMSGVIGYFDLLSDKDLMIVYKILGARLVEKGLTPG